MYTVLRRLFLLGLLGGAGFVGWSAWQRRRETVGVAGAPVWPPFDAPTSAPTTFATVPVHEAVSDIPVDNGTADVSHTHPAHWVPPVDGQCPDGYPIKANDNSGIFHVPGGRFYERTVPERCYADAADAEADGYRRAKA
jgi:hypothetical protein